MIVPFDDAIGSAAMGIDELDAAIAAADDERVTAATNSLLGSVGSIDNIVARSVDVVRALDRDSDRGDDFAALQDSTAELEALVIEMAGADRSSAQDADAIRQQFDAVEELGRNVTTLDPAVVVRPFASATLSLQTNRVDVDDHFAPAASALMLQHMVLTFAAVSLVADRELGLFEVFRVGPIVAGRIMADKYLAFILVGAAVAALLVVSLSVARKGLVGCLVGTPNGPDRVGELDHERCSPGAVVLSASVDPYELLLVVIGAGAVISAVLRSVLADKPLSLPILLVGVGVLAFGVLPLSAPDPAVRLEYTERLTELAVLVSLMGAGLAIDRPIGWRSWSSTWRLLAMTMPLGIVITAVLGVAWLGLPLASALLLGAVLAPTDPVLAEDVKVGEPAEGHGDDNDADDEIRVTLTSEAGLNDALAFPFVYLAITVAAGATMSDLGRWMLIDVGYRIVAGAAIGVGVGMVVQRFAFDPPRGFVKLAELSQGFVAFGLMLLAYGLAEIANGYGFLAVFAAAVTLRNTERHHDYQRVLHGFVEQLEHILVVVVLVLFGGSLVGGILEGVTAASFAIAAALVLLVRPLTGLLALTGGRTSGAERSTIAFFGIRGIGSLYYLSYALSAGNFDRASVLWATVAVTMLVSMVVHGVAATPVLAHLDRRGERRSSWLGRGARERGRSVAPIEKADP